MEDPRNVTPDDGEPSTDDLAAIECESGLIEAEMALLDAEIRIIEAGSEASEVDWMRLCRATPERRARERRAAPRRRPRGRSRLLRGRGGMNSGIPLKGDARDRHEATVWLLLAVLWRFGTGRPLFTVDGWLLSRYQRAAHRWTVIALGLGLIVAPGLTPATVSVAGFGFAAGAMWARRTHRSHPASRWTPPTYASPPRIGRRPVQKRSTDRLRRTGDATVLPLRRPTREDT